MPAEVTIRSRNATARSLFAVFTKLDVSDTMEKLFLGLDAQLVCSLEYNARVAKLVDAPDLGFRNRRFQNVPLRFKRQSIYEGKTRFFTMSNTLTTGE